MRSRDPVRLWQSLVCIAGASATLSLLSLGSLEPRVAVADGALCVGNPTCGDLSGTFTCTDGRHVTSNFDCNNLCQSGQPNGTPCATFDSNRCLEVVCGAGACGDTAAFVPPSCNDNDTCTIDTCDPCANNCSGACVHAPDLKTICPGVGGPFTCTDGRHVTSNFDCNDLCQSGQPNGTPCATFDSNRCLEKVCGAGACGDTDTFIPPSCNDNNTCTIDTCDPCANDCSGACVHQPDLTAIGCNLAPGDVCSAGFQCQSTFCADGVCCNRACTDSSERCNLAGSVGQCIAPAALAPVVSGRGTLTVGCLLAAIGLVGIRRAVRRPRG